MSALGSTISTDPNSLGYLGQYKYGAISASKTLAKCQVRIIELLPGQRMPSCFLHTMDLSVAAWRYEAVSYTWGNPKRTARIVCDGKSLAIPQSSLEVLE